MCIRDRPALGEGVDGPWTHVPEHDVAIAKIEGGRNAQLEIVGKPELAKHAHMKAKVPAILVRGDDALALSAIIINGDLRTDIGQLYILGMRAHQNAKMEWPKIGVRAVLDRSALRRSHVYSGQGDERDDKRSFHVDITWRWVKYCFGTKPMLTNTRKTTFMSREKINISKKTSSFVGIPNILFIFAPYFKGRAISPTRLHIVQKHFEPTKRIIMAYVISEDCIACGTCIDECPVEAISEGDIYKIDADACTECGSCAAVCPQEVIHLGE